MCLRDLVVVVENIQKNLKDTPQKIIISGTLHSGGRIVNNFGRRRRKESCRNTQAVSVGVSEVIPS
jgi:hypothetical protein